MRLLPSRHQRAFSPVSENARVASRLGRRPCRFVRCIEVETKTYVEVRNVLEQIPIQYITGVAVREPADKEQESHASRRQFVQVPAVGFEPSNRRAEAFRKISSGFRVELDHAIRVLVESTNHLTMWSDTYIALLPADFWRHTKTCCYIREISFGVTELET